MKSMSCKQVSSFKCGGLIIRMSLMFFIIMLGFFLQTAKAWADTGAEFSVTINKNSYQADNSKPYFYLKIPPKTATMLSLNIINQSNRVNNYTVTANRALTNSNMLIDYSPMKAVAGSHLSKDLDFNNFISPKKLSVQVKAHSSKTIKLNLKMPAKRFEGIILGGIYVRKNITQKIKNGYTNRFNYVTPILLKQNNNKVVPSLKLRKVSFATQNLTSTVNVNLSNVNKAYVDDLKTHAKIYRQSKKDKVIIDDKQINRSVAPNSDFVYQVPVSGQSLKPGTYVLDFKVISTKEAKEWHWIRTFKVSPENAQKAATVSYKRMGVPNWIWTLLGLLLLILLILVYLLLKKRRKDKD